MANGSPSSSPGLGLKEGALEGKVLLSYCRLLLRGNVGSLLPALPFFQEKSELLTYVWPLFLSAGKPTQLQTETKPGSH